PAEFVWLRVHAGARIGHPGAVLAVRGERSRGAEQLGRAGGEREPLAFRERLGTGLPVALNQLGLVVEQVQVRRRAGQVQVDHPRRAGREVRLARGERVHRAVLVGGRRRIPGQERSECDRAQAELALADEVAPGHLLQACETKVHRTKLPEFLRRSSRQALDRDETAEKLRRSEFSWALMRRSPRLARLKSDLPASDKEDPITTPAIRITQRLMSISSRFKRTLPTTAQAA